VKSLEGVVFHVVPQVLPLSTTVCTHKAQDFKRGKLNASAEPQFLIRVRKYLANDSLATACKFSVLVNGWYLRTSVLFSAVVKHPNNLIFNLFRTEIKHVYHLIKEPEKMCGNRSWENVQHCWGIIYNKPTRCNSSSIVFINNYKYALNVSDALRVYHQEHYKL